jgi:hypothetical protein
MNIVAKIKNALLYPLAYAHEELLSFVSQIKAIGKKPTLHFEKPYKGQTILLIALYENGCIRADIRNLLTTAKGLDIYVLAVNTLKVHEPKSLDDFIDCYIEQPNFGRDFGSYQTGFLHLYRQDWDRACGRVLMANDSIFFAQENLQKFLRKMIETNVEILGSTENFQYENHLGSFFISFKSDVVRDDKFRRFWIRYKKTNVRPKVIQRGELGLSKILKKVSSNGKLQALYDNLFFEEKLTEDDILSTILSNLPTKTDGMALPRTSLKEILIETMVESAYETSNQKHKIYLRSDIRETYLLSDIHDVYSTLADICETELTVNQIAALNRNIKGKLLSIFSEGSQIHQNCISLVICGCPIVKLDLLYRGVIGRQDVTTICSFLMKHERAQLTQALVDRPFGLKTLTGLDKVKFSRGLI